MKGFDALRLMAENPGKVMRNSSGERVRASGFNEDFRSEWVSRPFTNKDLADDWEEVAEPTPSPDKTEGEGKRCHHCDWATCNYPCPQCPDTDDFHAYRENAIKAMRPAAIPPVTHSNASHMVDGEGSE